MNIEKNFVITIGDFGSLVNLCVGDSIKESIFLDSLSSEMKVRLNDLFTKNRSLPVYIILDTLDQTYKRKSYPLVGKYDLEKIAKKEIEFEGDKNSLQNYIIYVPNKTDEVKKSECLYISTSKPAILNDWIDFLLEMENQLVGIYMLPVESFNLLEKIKGTKTKVKNKKLAKENNNLYCFVIQTKIGGVRQIIFSNRTIIFTRVVNYNFEEQDWHLRYEQDIYSTFEYLKRSFSNLNIKDLKVINILGRNILEKITSVNNQELTISNLTPAQFAQKIGYKNLLSEEEVNSDLLVAKVFSQKKKILKFTLPKIREFEKIFLILKSSKFVNFGLILGIIFTTILISASEYKISAAASKSQQEKSAAVAEYNKLLTMSKEVEDISNMAEGTNIEQVLDFGKINEALTLRIKGFITSYSELKFLKQYNVKLDKFSYSLSDFNQKMPNPNPHYQYGFTGIINNNSGDIDELFKEFDIVSNITKSKFSDYEVTYKEIPRTIDFTKKYYTFPIEFTFKK